MDISQRQAARVQPGNWNVVSNNGTVVAKNNVTGESFSDTVANFNAIFATKNNVIGNSLGTLVDSALPIIMPPTGTILTAGTLGQITLTVALPQIYDGGCWIYLPAAAITGGALGLWYAVMSSTTVGIVYNNFWDPTVTSDFNGAKPAVLGSPVSGSGSAYTAVTAATKIFTAIIPGTAMGPFGNCEVLTQIGSSNTAAAKTSTTKFGGTAVCSTSNTTTFLAKAGATVSNRGTVGRQVAMSLVPANVYMAINTDADVAVTIELASGAGTDLCVLERAKIVIS